ncbi:MAG: YlbF family regulator [Acutalibacteraceae bacterium]|nr:YlbF family regulator [Acutalibacteraceae bacterium]
MDVIKAARNLGSAMQEDERFVEYAKAKLALDKDEALQEKVGEFNIARMNIERMSGEENRDEEKFREANLKLREIYDSIMNNETMKAYNDAKTHVDKMMSDIMAILQMCSEGADPQTCEIPEGSCTGSCSSCSGCH